MSMTNCPWCMGELREDGFCTVCGRDSRTYAPTNEHLAHGCVLKDRYLVDAVLHEDASSTIYLGFDLTLHRKVSVKVGKSSWNSADAVGQAQCSAARSDTEVFLEEARIMARLGDSDGGLMGVIDVFEVDGLACAVMDYSEFETLRAYVSERGGRIPFADALALLENVIDFLQLLNAEGFTHGHLTPDTILVCGASAFLSDLGDTREALRRPIRGRTVAIRVAEDRVPYEEAHVPGFDLTVDVYDICSILYSSITGQDPPSKLQLLEGSSLVPPTQLGASITPAAEKVLLDGLSPEPVNRPPSVAKLKELLRETTRESEATATELPAEDKPQPAQGHSVPRNRVWLIAAIVAVAVAVVAVAAVAIVASRPRTAAVVSTAEVKDVGLAAGMSHAMLLHPNGNVRAKGNDLYGQCEVDEWSNTQQVSVGGLHSLGLKPDGTVAAAGRHYEGQCDVGTWSDVVAISAGYLHSVATFASGNVAAVGDDTYGQCDVGAWSEIAHASAGGWHTVGLRKDGTCVSTGANDFGQCDIEGWRNVTAVCSGYWHTVGLLKDGTCVATGNDDFGQCDVAGWVDVLQVAVGMQHTVALLADGTVVAVGDNASGQCEVSDWSGIAKVFAGGLYTAGIREDGSFVCAGVIDGSAFDLAQWYEEAGTGSSDVWEPLSYEDAALENGVLACGMSYSARVADDGSVDVLGSFADANVAKSWSDVMGISASDEHLVAICLNGTVVACGKNDHGQCDVSEWKNVVDVYAENGRTVALCSNGTVLSQGNNDHGQGDVGGWADIVNVSVSPDHTVGLRSDGTVVATGRNDKGQCDVSGWKNVVAVAVGSEHTVALCSDGTLLACGANDDGRCDVSEWSGVVEVSAGSTHTVARTSAGTVLATGSNNAGQCEVGAWADARGISASGAADCTYAILLGGMPVATGANDDGKCDVSGWTDVIAIASCADHAIAQRFDGTYLAVGNNQFGQCNVSTWN